MPIRQKTHAEEEKAIFDAFLTAHPSFAATVKEARQPDAEFPDVIVTLLAGGELDFELGEWLHGEQMAKAKTRERLTKSIEDAIGEQGPNPSPHFRAVMLTPREDVKRFDPVDRGAFGKELWALVAATHEYWPSERLWHSPQGRVCRDFGDHPTLGKYLSAVHFYPAVVASRKQPWPAGQPWIFVELPGGSYSPDTALGALADILKQKIDHYGPFSRPTRLVIHYGKAVAYNTPYLGVETRDFADVVALAADVVRGQTAYDRIYLLNAVEPGLELYEIYPTCARCT
jgi:hypothetical protein